jgi:hypothetical protein
MFTSATELVGNFVCNAAIQRKRKKNMWIYTLVKTGKGFIPPPLPNKSKLILKPI